nr:hypothetical protein [Tanacetum cinerariifolium]
MFGRGTGYCIVLGSAPSGPSFLVSPLVRSSYVDRGRAGKGGSWVLNPDLVIMAKVGASGGILSNHFVAFPLRERWKKRILDVSLVVPSAWVGGLVPVLLEMDTSSSNRLLPAIAAPKTRCGCRKGLLQEVLKLLRQST